MWPGPSSTQIQEDHSEWNTTLTQTLPLDVSFIEVRCVSLGGDVGGGGGGEGSLLG